MRATFLTLGLAAALAFATGDNTALAQHHGGGHGGGGHGGGHGGGGFHGGGYHGGYGGHYAHYGYGHYGYGHRYGYGYWPYIGAGLYLGGYGYYGSPGYDYYGWPGYAYGYGWPGYSYAEPYYYDAAPPVTYAPPAVPASQAQAVTLTVALPSADAAVLINGAATTSSGSERVFQSPPLDPGKSYQYTVTARWTQDGKPVEQTRAVPVKAGQSVMVNFR